MQPKTSREDLVLWPQWELHLVKSFSLLEQITLQHGKKSFFSEDQVVQYLDAKDVACLSEPSGYILVLHARLEIAAGVVVGHYNGSGSLSHCFGKDLPWVYDCSVDQADRTDVDGEHLVGPVEADGEEVLLHPGGIVPDEGVDVRRGGDLSSLGGKAPPSQLQGCADEGRLRGAQALDLDQFAVGHRRLAVEELH